MLATRGAAVRQLFRASQRVASRAHVGPAGATASVAPVVSARALQSRRFADAKPPADAKAAEALDEVPDLSAHSTLQVHYLAYLCKLMPKWITKASMEKGYMVLQTKREHLVKLVTFLKYHSHARFEMLHDLSAQDFPAKEERFHVFYLLHALDFNGRIRIDVWTDEFTPIDSLVPVHQAADWAEREVYDMFGVVFTGHPDLRRILTDYGFEGHPLRKDFPVMGYKEVRYDDELGRIVYEPLEATQEMRSFEIGKKWENKDRASPFQRKSAGNINPKDPFPPLEVSMFDMD